ncbi:MAG: hypothetical protein ACD_38C00063G0006 [uncultured bacterium]|uniref:Uncharacterized protein n=1 Tax=Candidatus Daviesbacteria bacterium GW2011_GWC2_40_12 TaxID=1618431 RepID=A0A0G0QW17_9BACT|nr:MAG: hypothetical protein ACD_38C00063G0006 [uncultured bacterium]KKR15938.1 MAG: hypothetical protein UT45_C0011G0021 [Candidatus Daviesbacteria bacterium GW2011_GWA2_39_33]KKR41546.1 MAG: hypothetical protein UT77_C0009G0004 [Candidatus Daviesbacteria bacterium GW2011_GWC2_40_12]OGE20782.1 MAG: hypothetical protein A2778_05935 [Candidatus Daviesbacteria bacterium RIFCSPHIGHO2_01_FULL_40_24]OGE28571.1 MAG: hypothetical protein A3C29_03135 [Candidatus Daviesbacteria bacterium RIFCSPHIGHO2_02
MADYQYFNHVPFMEDMAYSLRGLGLVHDMDTAHIIFNPTAVKEREVMIYSNDTGKLPNGDLSHAAFSVIEWWRRIGVTSFDMVVYMPPLGPKDESYWHNFYPLMRMVDRGSEGAKTSDFGTMEVYVSPVVASDQLKQSAMFGQYLESTQKLAAAA